MTEHDTILTIYNHLCDVYDQLPPAKQNGFADCLYLLSERLKAMDSINLHIENKRLLLRLKKAELIIDDRRNDNEVYKTRIQQLKTKLLAK